MLKKYLLLYGAFILYSTTLIFAKFASLQETAYMTTFFIVIEITVLIVYAVLWQNILKIFPLTTAIASKGITVVLSLLWAVLIFNEEVTITNIIGSLIIISGIRLVAIND